MAIPLTRRALSALVILAAACSADAIFGTVSDNAVPPGTTAHELIVGSLSRSYLLHVPAARRHTKTGATRPYPLMLLLHGSSGDAAAIEHASNMDALAEQDTFIVAYPNGSHGASGLFPSDWNAGACCGAAAREEIDDIGFLDALIRVLEHALPIDTLHVYIGGFSDGGRMAYHAACQLSERIAAIAVVSGSLLDPSCTPAKSVALIAIHGTADDQVAYDDSALTAPPLRAPLAARDSMPSSVRFWIAENNCTSGVAASFAADVRRYTFNGCTAPGQVIFYSIAGGLHAWPSEPDGTGSQAPMSEVPASQLIAAFLLTKARR